MKCWCNKLRRVLIRRVIAIWQRFFTCFARGRLHTLSQTHVAVRFLGVCFVAYNYHLKFCSRASGAVTCRTTNGCAGCGEAYQCFGLWGAKGGRGRTLDKPDEMCEVFGSCDSPAGRRCRLLVWHDGNFFRILGLRVEIYVAKIARMCCWKYCGFSH